MRMRALYFLSQVSGFTGSPLRRSSKYRPGGPAPPELPTLATGSPLLTQLAIILAAHIAIDRTFGYGLKLESGFHDTHLGRVGQARQRQGA